jgi:hypothetical protein
MKSILTTIAIVSYTVALSQVGIGTVNPDPSAALHLESTNKGVLFPRVSLLSSTDAITIQEPANGLLVYHPSATTVNGAGLYVNMGDKTSPQWNRFDYFANSPDLKVNNLIYTGLTTNTDKVLITEYYEWRMVKATATTYSVQARLRSAPTANVTIRGSVKLWTFNNSAANTVNTSWTTTDWSSWKNVYTYNNNWDAMMFINASNDPTKMYKLSGHVELDVYNLLVLEIF